MGADNFSDLNNLTAHNSFVLVLAETGIIGFTLWLAFVGYCFRMMLVVVRQRARVPGALPEAMPDPGSRMAVAARTARSRRPCCCR